MPNEPRHDPAVISRIMDMPSFIAHPHLEAVMRWVEAHNHSSLEDLEGMTINCENQCASCDAINFLIYQRRQDERSSTQEEVDVPETVQPRVPIPPSGSEVTTGFRESTEVPGSFDVLITEDQPGRSGGIAEPLREALMAWWINLNYNGATRPRWSTAEVPREDPVPSSPRRDDRRTAAARRLP